MNVYMANASLLTHYHARALTHTHTHTHMLTHTHTNTHTHLVGDGDGGDEGKEDHEQRLQKVGPQHRDHPALHA